MKKNGYVSIKRILAAAVAAVTAVSALPFCSSALKAWEKNDDGYYYGATQSGEKLTKAPGVTCRGIDISTWNGALNWTKIKKQYDEGTISFIIIRCGYGKNVEENDDDYWKRNADACTKYGIPFGAYFYSYALTVEDALDEAEHALRLIDGYNLTYPIYYDFENTKTQTNIPGQQKRDMVYAFCDKIKAEGYEVGFYSMRSWITNKNHLGLVDYEAKDYSLWIAEFNPTLQYTKPFDIWQCTSQYKLTGQSGGTCDVSFSYITERTVDHCYVTFDMNGRSGTPPKAIHANRGQPFGELPTAETDTGEHIIGWYTEPDGGEPVKAESICKINGRQTLYARWACDFELEIENVTATGGDLKQTVTSVTPFVPVTIKANDGYYLPSRIALAEGYSYVLNEDGTAVINGDPHRDAVLEVFGVENGALEPPVATDFFPEASSFGGSDGSVGGFTSAMEVSLKGDGSDAQAIDAAEGKTRRIEGLGAGDIAVRFAATADAKASRWIKLTVPSRAKTPEISEFTVTQPSVSDETGSILCADKYYEYSTDYGQNYRSIDPHTLLIDNLTSWKKVFVRRAEYGGYKPSEPLEIEIHPFTEDDAIDFAGQYVKTRTPLTTFAVNGSLYKTDKDGLLEIDAGWFGRTVIMSPAALVDEPDAAAVKLSIPALPAAPEIKVTDETVYGQKNGTITGADKSMEYSCDGSDWMTVTDEMADGSFAYEYDKEYRFRKVIYDDGDRFASEIACATIHSGKKIRITYKAEGFDDTVIEVGYGEAVKAPAVPAVDGANMELSCWDVDLDGKVPEKDTVVNAVYVEKGCRGSVSALAALPVLLAAAFVFGKKH